MLKPKLDMTKFYLLLLFFCATFLNLTAQSNCSEAQSYIVYALEHAETALASNNKTDAMYFAKKAKVSFESVQASLKNCDCDAVDDIVYNAIHYLSQAKSSVTREDAYYYANKGKKLAEATIENLDYCTVVTEYVVEVGPTPTNETDALASIAYEQEQLKQQQLALEQKQAELKQKLAQKKEQETHVKKEELVLKLERTIDNNIKTFNEALRACDCANEVTSSPIDKDILLKKSLKDIKSTFIDAIAELSADYSEELAVILVLWITMHYLIFNFI